ncbi:MAG: hypothetical protein IKD66_01920 [Solobacterium sp.]|nr:hypothetical protein [Solobacterium sp.]
MRDLRRRISTCYGPAKKEKIRTGLIQSGDIPEQTASLPLKAEGFTSVMSDCFLIALI